MTNKIKILDIFKRTSLSFKDIEIKIIIWTLVIVKTNFDYLKPYFTQKIFYRNKKNFNTSFKKYANYSAYVKFLFFLIDSDNNKVTYFQKKKFSNKNKSSTSSIDVYVLKIPAIQL